MLLFLLHLVGVWLTLCLAFQIRPQKYPLFPCSSGSLQFHPACSPGLRMSCPGSSSLATSSLALKRTNDFSIGTWSIINRLGIAAHWYHEFRSFPCGVFELLLVSQCSVLSYVPLNSTDQQWKRGHAHQQATPHHQAVVLGALSQVCHWFLI